MGRSVAAIAALSLLAASCGGDGGSSPAPSTVVEESSPSSTPSTVPVPDPPRGLLDPLPAEAIEWEAVGSGWVLFTFAEPDELGDPDATYETTIMLLSPADDVYEVGELPGPSSMGMRTRDVSSDGRTAIVSTWDGRERFWLLDLPTMELIAAPAPAAAWDVSFSNDDASMLVVQQFTTPEPSGASLTDRIVLARNHDDSTDVQALVDLPITAEQQRLGASFSFVELDSGEIATTELGSGWLRTGDGRPVRQLDIPSAECTFIEQWSSGSLLARCPDPTRPPECWTNGLFVISTTGDAAAELAMPSTADACYAGYVEAVPLDDHLALERGQGEGECTQMIEIDDGTAISTWQPDTAPLCNADLLGIRSAAWLALVRPLDGTFGSQYEGPGVLYEIGVDGTSRPITPTTLPSSFNTPGVSGVHIIDVAVAPAS